MKILSTITALLLPIVVWATPNAPSELTFTNITTHTVTLNWNDNSSDETGFKIYKGKDLLTKTTPNITSFTVSGLTPNTTYTFKVVATDDNKQSRYIPKQSTSWNIQLNGEINTNYNATLYEIDLFNTGTSMIEKLHQEGKKVICYLNAGAYESWREDASDFPKEILGNDLEGWKNEKWLDIRSEKLRPIMSKRLLVAKQKGCDGVEADNVNGLENPTGFPITAQDQLIYNKFLANEAHKHGLSIGLKNDLDQIVELEPYYDFSINEECNQYQECELLLPFINANKLVINIEYLTQNKEQYCSNSKALGLSILFLPLKLDGSFRKACN